MISRKWHSKVISRSKRWVFFNIDEHNCEVRTDDCKVYGHLHVDDVLGQVAFIAVYIPVAQ